MTNAKVTVTKEVAEAIEHVERNYISVDMALTFHVQGGLTGKYAPLQTLSIEDLAKALINGYEVEKSPEELEAERKDKVRGYYGIFSIGSPSRIAIKETLNILGIKIGGVNA